MSEAQQPETSGGALQGIRVVDLSRVLGGPFCTQLLADHGATVIKVEPPQGDETRDWGPPFRGDAASYFHGTNRNKLGVALDLAQTGGRGLLMRLLDGADILVENFKPGTLEKWGIGYEEVLRVSFPRLVHCSVSGFGASGPMGAMPGYDAVLQAMTGLMSVNGEPDGDALRMGVPVIDIVTGLNAAIGILLALQERQRSGLGQSVEATLFDSGISLMHPHLPNYLLSGKAGRRTGNAHPNICPYDSFSTASCPVFLAVGNDSQFRTLATVLGNPSLADELQFSTNRDRLANAAALKIVLETLLRPHKAEAIAQRLMEAGVPCGPVLDAAGIRSHPHALHRNRFIEVGDYVGVASPITLSRTPASYRMSPPHFGQDTRQALFAAGVTAEEIDAGIRDGVVLTDRRRGRPPA